jgi:hypothetical protein
MTQLIRETVPLTKIGLRNRQNVIIYTMKHALEHFPPRGLAAFQKSIF